MSLILKHKTSPEHICPGNLPGGPGICSNLNLGVANLVDLVGSIRFLG